MDVKTANKITLACNITVLGFKLAKKKIPKPVIAAICIVEGAVLINGIIAISEEVEKLK